MSTIPHYPSAVDTPAKADEPLDRLAYLMDQARELLVQFDSERSADHNPQFWPFWCGQLDYLMAAMLREYNKVQLRSPGR